ncbi:MAG: hypothetical protein P3W93_005280 [Thermus sp.]|nr:hypothetical protein [Thermus sp.]
MGRVLERLAVAKKARLALSMADDRHLRAHTYNEAVDQAIFTRLGGYARLMGKVPERMADEGCPL